MLGVLVQSFSCQEMRIVVICASVLIFILIG